MTDVLLRGVPDDVIAALDAKASRLGLSRSEYLRRCLTQVAGVKVVSVTLADLTELARTFTDLGDPSVMSGAWE